MVNIRVSSSPFLSLTISVYGCGSVVGVVGVPVIIPLPAAWRSYFSPSGRSSSFTIQ